MNTNDTTTTTTEPNIIEELLAGGPTPNGPVNDLSTGTGQHEHALVGPDDDDDAQPDAIVDSPAEAVDAVLDHVDDTLDDGITNGTSAPMPEVAKTIMPVVFAEFINESLRNVRAPFEAKMKRGKEFKAARTRLTKRADEAVRAFRAAFLPELTDEQAIAISLGITGLAGDNIQGFTYVDAYGEKV